VGEVAPSYVSVVLFCQLAGNDSNENKELRPVFSGVPTIMAGINGFSRCCLGASDYQIALE
jgi:hypothetical protein